jgi:hypothetical protein
MTPDSLPYAGREDPLAAMYRGMAIREGVDRSMHLNADTQALSQAPVRKPIDPALDEVAQQVAQPQLVIVISQEQVDQIVHKPTGYAPSRDQCG